MTCTRVESWLRRFPTPQRGAHALGRHDNVTHFISFAKIRHNMCRKETTTQPTTTVCTVLSCDLRTCQDWFWNTYSHVREHCGPPYRPYTVPLTFACLIGYEGTRYAHVLYAKNTRKAKTHQLLKITMTERSRSLQQYRKVRLREVPATTTAVSFASVLLLLLVLRRYMHFYFLVEVLLLLIIFLVGCAAAAAACAAYNISTEAERGTGDCLFLLRFCHLHCNASDVYCCCCSWLLLFLSFRLVMVVDCAAVETGRMMENCIKYFSPSPLLLLSFASILLLLLLLRRDTWYAFLFFGRGAAAANHFSCRLRCRCCWCLWCFQHQYWSRERYRLRVLLSTFLSFTLRCLGRLMLQLFLAASSSVL